MLLEDVTQLNRVLCVTWPTQDQDPRFEKLVPVEWYQFTTTSAPIGTYYKDELVAAVDNSKQAALHRAKLSLQDYIEDNYEDGQVSWSPGKIDTINNIRQAIENGEWEHEA